MIQIPIARQLSSGELVTPDQVPSGLQLDVTCLECGKPLICRKGSVNVWHFAHRSEPTCTGETWIHSFAKQIIKESQGKSLRLPDMGPSGVSCKVDKVRLEHHLDELSRRVDAYVRLSIHYKRGGLKVVVASNQWLAVELTVTHPKDDEYISQFAKANIPVLEVVLDRDMHADLAPRARISKLRSEIRNATRCKKWLHRTEAFAPVVVKGEEISQKQKCPNCDFG